MAIPASWPTARGRPTRKDVHATPVRPTGRPHRHRARWRRTPRATSRPSTCCATSADVIEPASLSSTPSGGSTSTAPRRGPGQRATLAQRRTRGADRRRAGHGQGEPRLAPASRCRLGNAGVEPGRCPTRSSPVVERIEEAGGVLLGSTVMPDWGMLSSGRLQPARHHPLAVGPVADDGRLELRRRRRGRRRLRPAPRRHRHRRVDPTARAPGSA